MPEWNEFDQAIWEARERQILGLGVFAREVQKDMRSRRERELELLSRIADDTAQPSITRAKAVLTIHQRTDVGGCSCGWGALGASFPGHQAEELEERRLLNG